MNNTTIWLAVAGLVVALLVAVNFQAQRIDAVTAEAQLQKSIAKAATLAAQGTLELADKLKQSLEEERTAQADLRKQQDQLRLGLATRNQKIKELTRENAELREWAAQQLPDAARRLRERPAITGADGYKDWLSSRDAVPPATGEADQ
jgi:LysB family phage lysis regulatory protein